MNISEDNVFKIGYTSVFSKKIDNKKRWVGFLDVIKKYKLIIITITIFLLASIFNFILLFNFFRILERIS